jgi:hypothetical protein
VNVEWICQGDRTLPSVFHNQYLNKGLLLMGESPSSLFVRMDPDGKIPIVKLLRIVLLPLGGKTIEDRAAASWCGCGLSSCTTRLMTSRGP